MRILTGFAEKVAMKYINKSAEIAKSSKCLRSKCGSVIVKDDETIGQGYNSPPGDRTLEKCLKDNLPADFKSDKTCCVHAEQRAIMNALARNPDRIKGSRLYFIRLDENENPKRAGRPYCTICSKMALDAGIKEFVLWHEEGICVYDTKEYNTLSFQYREA
ncbi:hypothetical protein KY312_02455 [Candidatus Woesearchaeota archaeon]|nr:hypothetical protein [Candidatus Woesearchaeota archaeon]